ncbi:HAD family hydrolase [Falsibacillus albus]|uniref:HAD family hydrolase n=1 Tax=Falsibacillus albus TaxID=2478915 RepID=UPI001F2C93D5|nr:HAD family hydrolase [Falsibacillus albus]
MVKAVLFDLYETLITEWENKRKKANVSVPALGLDEDLFKQEWSRRRELRMNGSYPDFKSCLRDIFHSFNQTPDENVLEEYLKRREASKAKAFEEVSPDIIHMLSGIKEREIKIGLISNCSPEEVVSWDGHELAPFFDTVLFSFQIKMAKPDPNLYKFACDRLGVSPCESIFIGDNGSDELNGAMRAGVSPFHAVWFKDHWNYCRKSEFEPLTHPSHVLEVINSGYRENKSNRIVLEDKK